MIVPPIAAAAAAFSVLLVLTFCIRKIRREKSGAGESKPPHRYSYSSLRRATASFSPSRRLGQGGFGSVFSATLPNNNQNVAVKVMDSGSLQGEREFQNELFFATKLDSPLVVSVLGFSSDKKRRRMLLVYELMPNGNLQDALLHRKCPELMQWKQRFSIAVEIAKGIAYLHSLDPPVIHGDIKPSNILLDQFFSAKIADFGLARLKSEEIQIDVKAEAAAVAKVELGEDNGSVVETESVATGIEDFNLGIDHSPESLPRVPGSVTTSPEMVTAASPEAVNSPKTLEKSSVSVSDVNFDRSSVGSGKELSIGGKKSRRGFRGVSGKDWWWKQDNGAAEAGKVKDYVMEWLGSEISKERPIASTASSSIRDSKLEKKKKKNEKGKQFEWWNSLDDDKERKFKKEKRRPPREWWKEEYSEELAKEKKKKKKKKRELGVSDSETNWWPIDEEMQGESKRKRKCRRNGSRSSVGSVDWLWDGLSGELWKGRLNSLDSGEIPKSGNMSSTPSMRGTVCYIAPEYGGGGDLSEKCDVYSFGVLMLVLIAGRRPLQVTDSPMSEFQRANLVSWARHLARAGKVVDLVDQGIQSLDKDQAILCITVALLCLQKSPKRRPSMKEVVAMLTGEIQAPPLPSEFSPSTPSRFTYRSRKKP